MPLSAQVLPESQHPAGQRHSLEVASVPAMESSSPTPGETGVRVAPDGPGPSQSPLLVEAGHLLSDVRRELLSPLPGASWRSGVGAAGAGPPGSPPPGCSPGPRPVPAGAGAASGGGSAPRGLLGASFFSGRFQEVCESARCGVGAESRKPGRELDAQVQRLAGGEPRGRSETHARQIPTCCPVRRDPGPGWAGPPAPHSARHSSGAHRSCELVPAPAAFCGSPWRPREGSASGSAGRGGQKPTCKCLPPRGWTFSATALLLSEVSLLPLSPTFLYFFPSPCPGRPRLHFPTWFSAVTNGADGPAFWPSSGSAR